MSELVSEFGQNYPELNEALQGFKTNLTEKSIEMFDSKLATSNIRYNITSRGTSFVIEADEVLLNTIDFAIFENLNDAVDTFVDDVMVTEPEDPDLGKREPIDVGQLGAIEQWVAGVKLNKSENSDEAERVYNSPNPKLEISKIALRIIRSKMARKELKESYEIAGDLI